MLSHHTQSALVLLTLATGCVLITIDVVGELSDGPISCKGLIVEAILTDARL